MGTIIPFLRDGAFAPDDITAMSMALDEVCSVLKLRSDGRAREVIAARIIDLARCGERSPARLRERVLREAGLAKYVDSNHAP